MAVQAGLREPDNSLPAGQGVGAGFGGEIALVDEQSGAVRLSPHGESLAAKGQVRGFRLGVGWARPRQEQ